MTVKYKPLLNIKKNIWLLAVRFLLRVNACHDKGISKDPLP
jgi:hypothetical protein